MEWTGWLTLAIAVLGAVLGVLNTMRDIYRDKVRLRVIPVWMTRQASIDEVDARVLFTTRSDSGLDHNPTGQIGIQVINTGFVEVTIKSVGFTRGGIFARLRPESLRTIPIMWDALKVTALPAVLPPRTSITIWSRAIGDDLYGFTKGITRAYVETACDVRVFGTSRLLRRLSRGRRHSPDRG